MTNLAKLILNPDIVQALSKLSNFGTEVHFIAQKWTGYDGKYYTFTFKAMLELTKVQYGISSWNLQ